MVNVTKGDHCVAVDLMGAGNLIPLPTRLTRYVEFDEEDGQMLAEKWLELAGGSKPGAFDECLLSFILACSRNDQTTINGALCARRWMRKNGWNTHRD